MMCGDIETCPGPNGRHIPEMESLLTNKGLTIFHQNVRGLCSNIDYITEPLHSFPNIHILTLSETHISVEDSEPMFEIPGYSFVSKHRENGKGGGVAAYISDKLVWNRRIDLDRSDRVYMVGNYSRSYKKLAYCHCVSPSRQFEVP